MALGSDADAAELAISLLDLTDLTGRGGDDTTDDAVAALCGRARGAGVAAVCVWPTYVGLAVDALAGSPVQVATVVNFPTGDEPLPAVLEQTRRALVAGAGEIDVVLPYHAWLDGDVDHAADVLDGVAELVLDPAPPAVMKVIIESGELPDRAAVDRATHFAIAHGARFVKTSTGKTPVSATLEAAETILEAIAVSGEPVGLKVSGGVRTFADARCYLELAERIMGPGWLSPDTFRFGASALLDDLLATARR